MKHGGQRNFGYGRSMLHAIKNIFLDKYGEGRYGTRHSHLDRLRLFVKYLKSVSIQDLCSITPIEVQGYAEHVRQLFESGEIQDSTGVNRISSVNVLMRLLHGHDGFALSPKRFIGARRYIRTGEPEGLDLIEFEAAAMSVLAEGEDRLAILICLCRLLGCRLREASLMDLNKAWEQAQRYSYVSISRGTKGNRGAYVPRSVPACTRIMSTLKFAAARYPDGNLVPRDKTYKQWSRYAQRRWSQISAELGLSSRFHTLRAAYACMRFEELLDEAAPCVTWRGAKRPDIGDEGIQSEIEALDVIARELGHSRIEILKAYLGEFHTDESEE